MALDIRLLALRCVYFFYTSGTSGLVRFLVILLDRLGYNAFEIGILSSTRPFTKFLASFWWGYVGDCTNSRLSILIIGCCCACISLSGLTINKIRNNIYYIAIVIIVTTFFSSVTSLLDAITISILQESSHQSNHQSNHTPTNVSKTKPSLNVSNKSKNDETTTTNTKTKIEDNEQNDNKKNKSGQYGATRLWGAVGWGLGAFICSLLVSIYGENLIIYFYDVNMGTATIILLFVVPFAIKSVRIKKETQLYEYKQSLLNEYDQDVISNDINKTNTTTIGIESDKEFTETYGKEQLIQDNKTDSDPASDKNELKGKGLLCEFCRIASTLNGFVFFMNLIIFGVAMAFNENYLFLFITKELDGPVYLCGLTISVMVAGEVPVFAASNFLLKKIGILGMLTISHIAFIVRVFGYTLLPEHNRQYSFYVLFLEPLHGLTYAGMWLASVDYGARIVPTHMQGTMQGILSGLYLGLASSIGAFGGGWIYNTFGPVWMYRGIGCVIFVWMILFQILFRISLKCKEKDSGIVKVVDTDTSNEMNEPDEIIDDPIEMKSVV